MPHGEQLSADFMAAVIPCGSKWHPGPLSAWPVERGGGDILAYHMAAHGLGFVEAAKQLNAWAGDDRAERKYRPTPLSARDALSVLADEATLIALEGTRIGYGIDLSAADQERVRTAAGRINHVRRIFS